ncbi:MAG: epoxyqueuosine reductase QueH [Lachnospiraceae bacterium]|nr:epoxyqueuosine reductase QueH [Lachnospiraceae bacterium]
MNTDRAGTAAPRGAGDLSLEQKAAKGSVRRNYQRELDQMIRELSAERGKQTDDHSFTGEPTAGGLSVGERTAPTLLLHSCCAPCSSYVLEYLSQYFQITVLYYNPNIYPEEEYFRRVKEQRRLIEEMGAKGVLPNPVRLLEGSFDSRKFYDAVRGLEQIPEGGARCEACFRLRLGEAARAASDGDFDYFTTTLTISPLKNAQKLNEIGEALAGEYQVKWLPCDFKKKNGYKRSVELSAEYGLYRQDYCGCVFSKQERERAKNA